MTMIGRQIGVYRIESLLGVGGMAEVYRGRDSRLGRDVAIKILPALFKADPDRLARLDREARVLAALNHPHIAGIHGIEESEGILALVLELVDGETLAHRIERSHQTAGSRQPPLARASYGGPPKPWAKAEGPGLPVKEALAIARQIADALEAAHDKGIVHRDLKPSNLAITSAGIVKVFDFGLAKAEVAEAEGHHSHASTGAFAGTRDGVILGTAAYMSPEQARGHATDKRTDIWAFGCVLYEMLTGRVTFAGNTLSDTIAHVLEREPDWNALPTTLPAPIRRLLRRCLEKDLRRRLHDIADARIEIDDAVLDSGRSETAQQSAAPPSPRRLGWMLAAVALGAALAAATAISSWPTPVDRTEIRLDVTTPETTEPASFAISPDGRHLVYVAAGDGPSRLWLRSLDSVAARPLPGTEEATYPFWSPDSGSVAFFAASGRLKRVEIAGGSPQTLADVAPGVGGTWGPGGVILFGATLGSPIYRISASGGVAAAVTTLAPRQTGHNFPHFLPDGRRFLFYAVGADEGRGIFVGSLDSEEIARVTAADTAGVYVAPGWLLFVRQGTLFAQRFDLERVALSGNPIAIADSVEVVAAMPGAGAFAASAGGVVTYRAIRASPRQLTWLDRTGKTLGTVGPIDTNNLRHPQVAPDGTRVAVDRTLENNIDIWVIDADRAQRVTSDLAEDQYPVWSPDGKRLAYSSERSGTRGIYVKPFDPGGEEELVSTSFLRNTINDWSPDGRFILYHQVDPKSGPSLWLLPLDGDRPSTRSTSSGSPRAESRGELADGRKPSTFLDTSFVEVWGEFSPDGRLVAYQSNESGRFEIYLRRFPGSSSQWPVSTSGGIYPQWSPDGKELYFVDPSANIMAAPVTATGTRVEVGVPKALFKPRMFGRGTNFVGRRRQYDVAPDGRFLVNVETEETSTAPITVILNWQGPPERP